MASSILYMQKKTSTAEQVLSGELTEQGLTTDLTEPSLPRQPAKYNNRKSVDWANAPSAANNSSFTLMQLKKLITTIESSVFSIVN